MPLVPSDTPSLNITAERIAEDLCLIAAARWCTILIDGEQQCFASVAVPNSGPFPWRADAGESLLRRVLLTDETLILQQEGYPLIATRLDDTRQIGAVLLGFPPDTPPNIAQILVTVRLAGRAVYATQQVDALQQQVDQVIEGMRLREIQRSRNLIRGIIDSLPIGLALIDTDGSIRAINRTLADRVGKVPADIVGLSYDDVIGTWDDAPASRTLRDGSPQRTRRSMSPPNQPQRLLEISSFPIQDASGVFSQVVEVWEDITDQVAMQTQLVRAEKLAAIGQLAASIAHEVGNPLQAIQGFLSLFLEQSNPSTPNLHFLQLAEEEIERIGNVLARLRDLYRPRADVVAPTQLNDLVEAVLLLTGKQLERNRIRVRRELTHDLPQITIVADQIKQVILNLILNAADAMQQGGTLHIQTYLKTDRNGNRMAVLAITDTGVGVAAELVPYLFDGLHTTKERGMGLGLYTSKAIIERHMGRIVVQSVVGEGTTFTITLPVREAELSVQE
ncbi:MAG: hypothetical protein Fur005_29610 [Roseiflexaceae bacterium]